MKPALIVGALAALAVAIVLTVFPGPAFVFYGLAGALAAPTSLGVARTLDRAEVGGRRLTRRLRRRWARATG